MALIKFLADTVRAAQTARLRRPAPSEAAGRGEVLRRQAAHRPEHEAAEAHAPELDERI